MGEAKLQQGSLCPCVLYLHCTKEHLGGLTARARHCCPVTIEVNGCKKYTGSIVHARSGNYTTLMHGTRHIFAGTVFLHLNLSINASRLCSNNWLTQPEIPQPFQSYR